MNPQDVTLTSTTDPIEAVTAALGADAQVSDPAADAAATQAAKDAATDAAAGETTKVETEVKTDVETKADATATPESEAIKAAEAEAVAAAAKAKKVAAGREGGQKKSKLTERISELVTERNEARGEVAATKAQVAALTKKVEEILGGSTTKEGSKTTEVAAPEAPKVEDFADYDQYLAAREEYLVDRVKSASKAEVDAAVKQALAEREKEVKATANQAAQEEAAVRYQKSVASAMVRHEDFEEMVNKPVKLTHVMFDGISDSEVGGEMAYYLATHDEERKALFAKGETIGAVKALGKLEAKIEAELAAAAPVADDDDDAAAGGEADADDDSDVDDNDPLAVAEAAAVAAAAKVAELKAAAAKGIKKKVATTAPDPIKPTKGGGVVSTVPHDQLSFDAYKAIRKKEMAAQGKRL